MVLMAAIVAILFSSYKEFSLAKKELQADKDVVFNKQRLRLRLEQIFSQLISWREIDERSYSFTYNNGADLDPSFRGEVEGMIYLDEKKSLYVITWGKDQAPPRLEMVATDAEQLVVKFFDSSTGNFVTNYPQNRPFMIKVYLSKNKNNHPIPLVL